MPASDLKRPFKAVGKTLRCERETAACAAEHELLGHLLLGEIDEILSAAMHRHDKSYIELLQLGHHTCQIIAWRRSKMEAANECIDLFNAGDFLRALERIDDAAVATRRDHDEPTIPHPEAGSVLVPV